MFIGLCRKAGLKVTPQRIEIYRVLAATDEHPDAETIFCRVRMRFPTISFNTVYQNLKTLQEKGLVARTDTPVARTRLDANVTPHHHFVCERCGAIRDVFCRAYDRLPLPRNAEAIGLVRLVRVEVRGVCNACRTNASRKQSKVEEKQGSDSSASG